MVPELHYEDFSRQFRPWKISSIPNRSMQTFVPIFAHISAPAEPCILPLAKYGKAKRPPGVADMCQRIRGRDAPSKVHSGKSTL